MRTPAYTGLAEPRDGADKEPAVTRVSQPWDVPDMALAKGTAVEHLGGSCDVFVCCVPNKFPFSPIYAFASNRLRL